MADVTTAGGTEAMANAGIGATFFDGWNSYFAAMNMSGMGETVNYTTATGGDNAGFTNLTYAFNKQ